MQNEMRDRLVELLNFVQCKAECCSALDGGRCGDLDNLDRCQIETIADHLLENGVIVPPCKVGDTVYQIDDERVYELKVKNVIYDTPCIAFDSRAVGNGLIFLTKEQAEKALKEREIND